MTGCIQIYTGDGKGKTTAALGLALRAHGAGLRVFFGQFIKGREHSEIRALRERLPEVTVEQFGHGRFIRGTPAPDETAAARHGLDRLREALTGGRYDVVIADEACSAVQARLFPEDDLLALMEARPPSVELVLTGRAAGPRLQARADLVTEMHCVKHYYQAGVDGRPGIES
jgi:cob(I)alamin adenosyltransferase